MAKKKQLSQPEIAEISRLEEDKQAMRDLSASRGWAIVRAKIEDKIKETELILDNEHFEDLQTFYRLRDLRKTLRALIDLPGKYATMTLETLDEDRLDPYDK